LDSYLEREEIAFFAIALRLVGLIARHRKELKNVPTISWRLVVTGLVAVVAWPVYPAQDRQPNDCSRPIAHVVHDGVNLSVSIGPDGQSLVLVVPERSGVEPRPVLVRLRFRDESVVEGVAIRQVSVGGGGFTDWSYRFDARRQIALADIFSVTVSVDDQSFEMFPW
jgi:hypothetical protein